MFKIYLEGAFLACTCKADLKCVNISQQLFQFFCWFFFACESIQCDLICLCLRDLPGGGGGIPPCIICCWPEICKYMFTDKSDS